MIIILDYDNEETSLFKSFLEHWGIINQFKFTHQENEVCRADKIILPGTREIITAVKKLQVQNLFTLLKMLNKPMLGIGAGTLLMCDSITGYKFPGLGLFPLNVESDFEISEDIYGFRDIEILKESKIFKNAVISTEYYFEQRHFIRLNDFSTSKISTSKYDLSSSLEKSNCYGVLFNIYKSGKNGIQLLKNFLE
ncbi:MAG: hypothetical protein A2V66_13340 [Ignavibacteria bacterium RBG_13_36_8]|nr:MAG: hypothetical protein A2V66_13340 [Ignavibacteria bacterium RBG_13_36_8]